MSGIRFVLTGLLAAMVVAGLPGRVSAQNVVSTDGLPDAPGEVLFGGQSVEQGTGTITGVVLDINEGIVAGAKVTLIEQGRSAAERVTESDSTGRFTFLNLPVGRFVFKVTAPGLQNFVSSEIVLRAGERRELPQIALPIASATADVQVTVTEEELAQEQIALEEKQRVLGVLPNFYTSYIWNAAPLTKKQKYGLAARSAIDPTEFLGAAVQAGAEQYAGTFAGYGDDAAGYGKRFAAAYGDGAIARMIGSAVLPSLLHQDPRYFYRGSGTRKSRALYAVKMAVLARGDDGRLQPAYSYIGGAFASGAIANAYHPHADRGTGLIISNGFIDIAGHAAQNLIREFVTRGLTKGVPDYENGKEGLDTTAPTSKKDH